MYVYILYIYYIYIYIYYIYIYVYVYIYYIYMYIYIYACVSIQYIFIIQIHNDANMSNQKKSTSCFRLHFLDVAVTKKLVNFAASPWLHPVFLHGQLGHPGPHRSPLGGSFHLVSGL